MTKLIKKDYSSKEIKPMFGGSKVLVHYYVETINYDIINKYEVTCQIRGIESGNPEMSVERVQAWTNNEETLIAVAIAELCGWDCGSGVETETREGNSP